ncbi:MAG: hypothetical protein WD533_07925, partial [Dehalococcoidia bacterium]
PPGSPGVDPGTPDAGRAPSAIDGGAPGRSGARLADPPAGLDPSVFSGFDAGLFDSPDRDTPSGLPEAIAAVAEVATWSAGFSPARFSGFDAALFRPASAPDAQEPSGEGPGHPAEPAPSLSEENVAGLVEKVGSSGGFDPLKFSGFDAALFEQLLASRSQVLGLREAK